MIQQLGTDSPELKDLNKSQLRGCLAAIKSYAENHHKIYVVPTSYTNDDPNLTVDPDRRVSLMVLTPVENHCLLDSSLPCKRTTLVWNNLCLEWQTRFRAYLEKKYGMTCLRPVEPQLRFYLPGFRNLEFITAFVSDAVVAHVGMSGGIAASGASRTSFKGGPPFARERGS